MAVRRRIPALALAVMLLGLGGCVTVVTQPVAVTRTVATQSLAVRSVGVDIAESLSVLTGQPPVPGEAASIDSAFAVALDRLDDTLQSVWHGAGVRSGTIRPLSHYLSDRGESCRVFAHEHTVAGRLYPARGIACRFTAGIWYLTANEWFLPIPLKSAAGPATRPHPAPAEVKRPRRTLPTGNGGSGLSATRSAPVPQPDSSLDDFGPRSHRRESVP